MTVTEFARRTGAALAASAAVLAACVACSSSSNGHGNPAPGALTTPVTLPSTSIAVPSVSVSESVPVLGASSVGNGPAGGGNFCKDFNPTDVANMGNASDIGNLVRIFDKVAADAPAAIKPQAQEVDQFLHDAENGKVDSDTSKITKDVEDITRYYIANCK